VAGDSRSSRGRANSRDRILRAARELFVEETYAKTSMAMIGDRAGVVRATVYNNFSDKVAILAEIIRDYMDGYVRMVDAVKAEVGDDQSSFGLIEQTIARALAWRAENAELRPLIDIAKHLPESGWDVANARADRAMLDWLISIHRRDARRGLIHSEPDLQFATAAAYGVVDAGLALFNGVATPGRVARTARKLSLVYWHAIYRTTPPPKASPRPRRRAEAAAPSPSAPKRRTPAASSR
jgi:AcrR family transcriptional regulator